MKQFSREKLSSWIFVPLRLFLGVTFVYAGVQKLADPQYFNPAARGYIGRQIAAFAAGSPLHGFLTSVAAPHAILFGGLVAYGELAIGLGVLLGLLLRVAALFGLLLNLVFFLSADWHIFPYFYGSDIIFAFAWLTLLMAGPAGQALPALDTRLVRWLMEHAGPRNQPLLAALCSLVFGVKVAPEPLSGPQTLPGRQQPGTQPQWIAQQPASRYKAWQLEQARQQSRRNFLWGTLAGGAAMLALAWLAETLHLLPGSSASDTVTSTQVTPALGSPVTGESTPASTSAGSVIAKISDVQVNSSVNFTLPANSTFNGDPGILIHLNNGQFVAFDASCTHAGCPVDYDPSSQQLVCPCHGAAFNPAKSAAVLNGPAQTPLTSVPIKVDQSAGTISLGQ